MKGIIYVLTNPMIPDLVMIGKIEKIEKFEDLKEHVLGLSLHPSVPAFFDIYYAIRVDDSNSEELNIHYEFRDSRINPDRDFFRVNPERVLLLLKKFKPGNAKEIKETEDVTGHEERLRNRERRTRTKLKFSSLGIPPGSTLTFIRDNDIKATVANDDLNVILEGEEEHKPLWQATLDIMNNRFEKKWSVTHGPSFWGPDYWVYENESLSERRIRMESGE